MDKAVFVKTNGFMKDDERLALIQEQILKFTQLDFTMSLPVSQKGDDLDAIIVGLNTLGEELGAIKITRTA